MSGQAKCAALADETYRACRGHAGSEGRVQGHLRFRVEDTQAVGPDHAHLVALADLNELELALHAFRSALPEARRDDDKPLHALLTALLGDSEHGRGRDHHDREIDRIRDVQNGRVGLDGVDVLGLGIDREQLALKVGLDQVVENLPADRSASGSSPDDRDGIRTEDRVERLWGRSWVP
jgi:hypothetical protein